MSNSSVCMFVILWGAICCLSINVNSKKVIAAVVDKGCTHPHEILDPILDKIVERQQETHGL